MVGADAFAKKVGEEKIKVNAENEAAMIEKVKCEQIAVEVSEKQTSCESDLAAAEPLVQQVRNMPELEIFSRSTDIMFYCLFFTEDLKYLYAAAHCESVVWPGTLCSASTLVKLVLR